MNDEQFPTVAANTAPEPEADLARSGVHWRSLQPDFADVIASTDSLLACIKDPNERFGARVAAGTLLALAGDPRITTLDPTMVTIDAGVALIGIHRSDVDAVVEEWSPFGVERSWIAKETPRHSVAMTPFAIGKYPVTNGEYLDFVVDTPTAERPTSWPMGTFPAASANHPVCSLSPEAADRYCAWLNERTGRAFRLPTEYEWEAAATGGDGRQYPWGDDWRADHANTAEAGLLTTTPVGVYPSAMAPCGALDMAGNVEEYVADGYRPYPGGEHIDDDLTELHGEEYRIARGGSFARHGDLARCQRRHGWYPSDHYAMGFRLAESLADQ